MDHKPKSDDQSTCFICGCVCHVTSEHKCRICNQMGHVNHSCPISAYRDCICLAKETIIQKIGSQEQKDIRALTCQVHPILDRCICKEIGSCRSLNIKCVFHSRD